MVRAEKEKVIVLLCERHETRKQEISRVSRAVTAKKYTKTKKCVARAELLFCLSKLLVFERSRRLLRRCCLNSLLFFVTQLKTSE